MIKTAAGLFVALALAAPAAFAEDSAVTKTLDEGAFARLVSDLPPAVRYLKAQGVKLTHLGKDGGLDAYLGESPTGRMQTFYVAPDGDHVIAGLMFRTDGINVTGVQIGEMQRRFREAQKQAEGAPPSPSPAVGTMPSDAAEPASAETSSAGTDLSAALQWRSPMDRTVFETAVDKAAWFQVGDDSAPVLYVVVDPQCPYCHRAWERLRPLVLERKLQLRPVMIAGLPGSEPLARSILAMPEPGKAWLAGQGSSPGIEVTPKAEPGSPEWNEAGTYLAANMDFARALRVTGTPHFVYVGADGAVYESAGLPEDDEAFLAALR